MVCVLPQTQVRENRVMPVSHAIAIAAILTGLTPDRLKG